MHEQKLPTYDFKRAFSGHESVHSRYLVDFIESEDFKVVALEVYENNPYIKAGESPTGVRDLDYSKKIEIIHQETGAKQILIQDEDTTDLFHLSK